MTRWPRNEDSETSLPSASSKVKSGAWSPGASRLSVMCALLRGLEPGDERGQCAEGAAAVADGVLGLGGHLGGGLLEAVGQEDGVVAEAPGAARRADQAALDLPGHHPLARAGARHDQGGGAGEPGAQPRVR